MNRMSASSLPKITVVTPSYSQGEFLEEMILSVQNQRYPNLEHILVDGGSTDSTLSVLEKYQSHFAYCVSEKDSGQTNAINKGLARATGDLIGVLNSDDVYLPGALDFVAEQFAERPSLRWMTAPSLYFGPGLPRDHAEVMVTEVPKSKAGWLVHQTIPHPSTFIRREVMEKHGVYDESFFFGMDYEYWCRLAFGGEICQPFTRPLSAFRLHELSKSVSEQPRRTADGERILQMYLPQLPSGERERTRKMREKSLGNMELYRSIWPLSRGDREEAKRMWAEALNKNPQSRFSRAYFSTWLKIALNRP